MPSTQTFETNVVIRRALAFVLGMTLFGLSVSLASPPEQQGKDVERIVFTDSNEFNDFIDYMIERHGFERSELNHIVHQLQFSTQSLNLIKPAPITKPKNWVAYRARFIEPIRINAGVRFWNTYADALARAERTFGVPAHIIVGVIGVETFYGKTMGTFRVLDVLATLGFTYPDTPNRDARMTYFRGELEQALLLARESAVEPFSLIGSYAGAIGWPQFMPSSIRHYAIDFDGDGKIDVRASPVDAIGSVANFLVQHGWQPELPLAFPAQIIGDNPDAMVAKELNATVTLEQLAPSVIPIQHDTPAQLLYGLIDLQNGENPTEYWFATQNFFAITQYNRSYFYAMAVIELGKAVSFQMTDGK